MPHQVRRLTSSSRACLAGHAHFAVTTSQDGRNEGEFEKCRITNLTGQSMLSETHGACAQARRGVDARRDAYSPWHTLTEVRTGPCGAT